MIVIALSTTRNCGQLAAEMEKERAEAEKQHAEDQAEVERLTGLEAKLREELKHAKGLCQHCASVLLAA